MTSPFDQPNSQTGSLRRFVQGGLLPVSPSLGSKQAAQTPARLDVHVSSMRLERRQNCGEDLDEAAFEEKIRIFREYRDSGSPTSIETAKGRAKRR